MNYSKATWLNITEPLKTNFWGIFNDKYSKYEVEFYFLSEL